uniref:Uncharacterized protein n=1 Tax=Tetradesmus obliquus TaxID=3088 RepID=A0A383WPG0_TETOB|eukprot:jgi/Sobl393_1/8937/SZX79347.1
MSTDEPDLEQQCSELGITIWKQRIHPVRVPHKARDGSLLLDFPSEAARQQFKQACIHKVSSNCLDGARSGCCLRAMDHCRGPAWLRWLPWNNSKPWAELEACEDRYVEACMAANAKGCTDHAESFCTLVVARPAGLEDTADEAQQQQQQQQRRGNGSRK